MKTFQQLREELKSKESYSGMGPDGVPCGMISQGSHSRDMGKPDVDQDEIGPDGVPCGVIFHGSHSFKDGEEFDSTKHPVYDADDFVPTIGKNKVNESDNTNDDFFSKNDNAHIHPTESGLHKTLVGTQKREGLDHAHLNAYTRGSRMVNTALWSAHKYGNPIPNHVSGFAGQTIDIKGLDSAIKRNKLQDDVHVYSGMGRDPSDAASKHPENHYHLPAYTSTTTDKTIARNFAANQAQDRPALRQNGLMGHILHLKVPKGHAAAYLNKESHYSHERELLLPRDTTVKITHSTVHSDNFSDPYLIHHGEIVPKTKSKKK